MPAGGAKKQSAGQEKVPVLLKKSSGCLKKFILALPIIILGARIIIARLQIIIRGAKINFLRHPADFLMTVARFLCLADCFFRPDALFPDNLLIFVPCAARVCPQDSRP